MTSKRNLPQEIKDWYRSAFLSVICLVISLITLLCSTFLALVLNYTFTAPIFHQIANIFEALFLTSIIALIISAIWSIVMYAND